MRTSALAHGIQTSPIITLAAEINEKIQQGERFYNLTIGDFNPRVFPIPAELREEIIAAYQDGQTNYPGAAGIVSLRNAVADFLQRYSDIRYDANNILISGGARPLLYTAYQAVVDPGDQVIFPVPSWNNDYYSYLNRARAITLETKARDNFMPTAEDLAPHLKNARLLVLCSPLNPTGTVLSKEGLADICELVLAENRSRGAQQKPLYVIFDQIYWLLTFGDTRHYQAVNLRPDMRQYAIFIDGISKIFSATGVRVGWGFGPADIIKKMRSFIAHIGAWAPRPEQVGTANYLANTAAVEAHLQKFRREVQQRLEGFYRGFQSLREKGHRVNAIEPQAAMYLTVQLDLRGARTAAGTVLDSNPAVHRYILEEAKVGLVPFSYFGASEDSTWYRLSVGTCPMEDVNGIVESLETALGKLTY